MLNLRNRSQVLSSYFRMGVGSRRARLLIQASFWTAAIASGVFAVYFTKLIEFFQHSYQEVFLEHPLMLSLLSPFVFVAATAVVRYLAPHAGGSGVPQILHASALSNTENQNVVKDGLLSIRTSVVKVLSTCLGFLGGASIGGEGPTVQISGAIFATFGSRLRKKFPHLDLQSYLVAAAGAGIAAAFNTPLGGLVFALEEFSVSGFGPLRHMVMIAVIFAGITTRAFVGNHLYLGDAKIPEGNNDYVFTAIAIGIIGGILGSIFSRIVASKSLHRLPFNWWQSAAACGIIVATIGFFFGGTTSGTGYEMTRNFVSFSPDGSTDIPMLFPIAKLVSTAFSTLSGIGGGILAPSLTIGAWMGVVAGKLAMLPNLKICALLGMVAYFTGAFQIPMTAFVVVMEMTSEHAIIFPMMIAALTAHLVARAIMPVSLYHVLVERNFHPTTLAD